MKVPLRYAGRRLISAILFSALVLSAGSKSALAQRTESAAVAPSSGRNVTAPHGMVVSASSIASDVGRNILVAGGNAVDAAVATVVAVLETMGYKVGVGGDQGTAHSIRIDSRTGARQGAPDPRDRDGGAAGH